MSKFLETHILPVLNHEEIKNINRPITSSENESGKKIHTNESPEPISFTGEFYQIFKEELIPIFLKLSLKIKEQGTHPNLFYEPSITLIAKPDNHTHTHYSPEYLMKTDIKIFYKILQNAFNITLEGSYTMINWDSF